ncbi:MAG: prepilin-type N-terminal cleavage/methylation domain-containing protein [Phycisphaerales bacterium]|jgi:prepilin-type N-terminal cleavage/methylation domain-containing protein|nr:prepilin-type N-terminal cleavage/methylation domain-containing protein [Phycisphaerales bacterium]
MSNTEKKYQRGFVRSAHRPGAGFTLIELLIVIAIIALLAAILFPSLSGSREHQYDVHCKSNIRKLMPGLITDMEYTNWKSRPNSRDLSESLRCPKGSFENSGAQALNVTGSISELNPIPESVVPNHGKQSNSEIFGFQEQEGYVLPAPLSVDITKPGGYGRSRGSYSSSSGTIAAGTPVDSYYLIYDPSSSGHVRNGTITVSTPIIGVIVQTKTLDKTDSIIGRKGITYPRNQHARGFESNAEEIELSDDMLTLRIVNFSASFPGEHVRIITEAGGMGSGSYGVNGLVDPMRTRPDQILMSEYGSSIIYPHSNVHDDTLDRLYDEDRLHFGRLNVGLVSGSVISLEPENLESNSPWWRPDE